jgi:hypothetical protein
MQNELPIVQPARSTCCAGLWLLLAGLLGAGLSLRLQEVSG